EQDVIFSPRRRGKEKRGGRQERRRTAIGEDGVRADGTIRRQPKGASATVAPCKGLDAFEGLSGARDAPGVVEPLGEKHEAHLPWWQRSCHCLVNEGESASLRDEDGAARVELLRAVPRFDRHRARPGICDIGYITRARRIVNMTLIVIEGNC